MSQLFKVFFIWLVLFATVNANESKKIDVVVTTGEYISAKAYYHSGDYITSYQMFEKLFTKHSDHVYVNYYLAMSAVQLKKYDEATAAFERVLIKDPDFHRARLEFAKVLYIIGFKEQAKKEFSIVLNSNAPKNVKENIKTYLASLEDEKLFTLYATLMVGWHYSDNVNNGLDDIEYKLPGFSNITVSGQKPQSDSGDVEYLGLDFVNKFKNSSLILKNKLIVYNKNYGDYDTGNLRFYSYQPTLIDFSATDKRQYSLGLSIDKVVPGVSKNDRFMAYAIIPKYSFEITPELNLASYAKYQKVAYDESLSDDRDYIKKELGVDLYYKRLSYGLSYAIDTKDKGSRTDIDKNIVQTNIGYSYMFNQKLILNGEYEYTNIKYDEEDIFFASRRKDTSHEISLSLIKLFDKENIVNLSASRKGNRSNQEAYDYDKDSLNISYIRRFQW